MMFYLDNKDIDIIAKNYSKILPNVFGKWAYLKSKIGDRVYGLKILSRGLLLDNPQIATPSVPLYELMSFNAIKYRKNYESISEEELANQISYWFYSNLLYNPVSNNKKKNDDAQKLKSVLDGDEELKEWFSNFFQQVKKFYSERTNVLEKSTIF